MKVPFSMLEISRIKIITHRFNVDNAGGNAGIGSYIIIGHGIMLQLGLKENVGLRIMLCDETVVMMNLGSFLKLTWLR